MANNIEEQWLPVIGRSFSFIALHMADLSGKSISDRAAFLQTLGLPKEEIASMLNSSPASIAELLRQRSKKGDASGESQKVRGKKGSK